MTRHDDTQESPGELADALNRAARTLEDTDPLRALGMAEVAVALARAAGDDALGHRAARTADACRRHVIELRARPEAA